MNQTSFLKTILICIFLSLTTFGQPTENTFQESDKVQNDTLNAENNSAKYDASDDFSPGLLFFAMIGLVILLLSVGAGIVLTVLVLFIVFGLVSFGVLSTSIIVGLNKRSFMKGFKTLIILTSIIGGILFSSIGFWLLNNVLHWWTVQTAILTGAISGLLAGLAFGLLAFYVLQRLTTYFKQKLNLTTL